MKPVRIRRVVKDIYLKEPSEKKKSENAIWAWLLSLITMILRFFGLWKEPLVETKTEFVSPMSVMKKKDRNDEFLLEPKMKSESSTFSRLQQELTKAIERGDEKRAAELGSELARLSKKRNFFDIYNR